LSVGDSGVDASVDASPSADASVDVAPSCHDLASADCNLRSDCQALYCPNCNWGQSFVGCESQGGGELSCNARPCASSSEPRLRRSHTEGVVQHPQRQDVRARARV
jgi:hypothetical protein